jgi:hypothetical protein
VQGFMFYYSQIDSGQYWLDLMPFSFKLKHSGHLRADLIADSIYLGAWTQRRS